MAIDEKRDQRIAAMVGQWPNFFEWLKEHHGFGVTSVIPGEAQYCPIHGGDSGEAFRFFEDFAITGGGLCNSGCGITFASGDKLVGGWLSKLKEQLPDSYNEKAEGFPQSAADPKALANFLIEDYLDHKDIELPAPRVGMQVARWVSSIDTAEALKYLRSRGLMYTPQSLPPSLRGTKRYWAHPKHTKATGLVALVYSDEDIPLTHQIILTNRKGEKLGTRDEDQALIKEMQGDRKTAPPIKRLASLKGQASLEFRYVPLGDPSSKVLLLGEGVETVLAGQKIYEHTHGKPANARAMVGSPYSNQVIPPGIRQVFALIDNDHTVETAEQAISQLAAEYPDVEFFMVVPPRWSESELTEDENRKGGIPAKGKDWLDAWVRYSPDRCKELWQQGERKVEPGLVAQAEKTDSSPSRTGADYPRSPAKRSGGYQSNRGGQNRTQPRKSDLPEGAIVAPVSDADFFHEMNQAIRSWDSGFYITADQNRIFTVEQGRVQALSIESIMARLAENFRFYSPMNERSSGTFQEIEFPESRLLRWIRTTTGFRLLTQTCRRLTGAYQHGVVQHESGACRFIGMQGYNAEAELVISMDDLHQRAISRADKWLALVASNPGRVIADIRLLNDALAQSIKENPEFQTPEVLSRVTCKLLYRAVIKPSLEYSAADSEVMCSVFAALWAAPSALPSRCAQNMLEPFADLHPTVQEAIAGAIYFMAMSWVSHGPGSGVDSAEEFTAEMGRWIDLSCEATNSSSAIPIRRAG